MKLYSHWRSSASYRVRIALNLKALTCEHVTLDLDKSHADQHRPEYRRVNPQGVVPSLELDNGTVLMQSEYGPSLDGDERLLRTRLRSLRQRPSTGAIGQQRPYSETPQSGPFDGAIYRP